MEGVEVARGCCKRHRDTEAFRNSQNCCDSQRTDWYQSRFNAVAVWLIQQCQGLRLVSRGAEGRVAIRLVLDVICYRCLACGRAANPFARRRRLAMTRFCAHVSRHGWVLLGCRPLQDNAERLGLSFTGGDRDSEHQVAAIVFCHRAGICRGIHCNHGGVARACAFGAERD
jgi:hypothetical protein